MTFLNEIILDTIENTNFVHMIELDSIYIDDNYKYTDIIKFFDYLIYHVLKIDELMIKDFKDLSELFEMNVKLNQVESCLYVMKSFSLPNEKMIENKFIEIYNNNKYKLDCLFMAVQNNDKCIFYIYIPKYPDDILILTCYKNRWLEILKNNENMSKFSDMDILVFLSGYVYLFRSKNPFKNIFKNEVNENKIYMLFYA